jgi:cysteine-rich repeat protein
VSDEDIVFRSGYEQAATCGKRAVEEYEACDDGGTQDLDGCSASCAVEPAYVCTGSPSSCVPDCQAITLSPDTGFTPATIPKTWAELTGAAQFPGMELDNPARRVPYKPGLAYLGASRNHYVSSRSPPGPDAVHSGDLSFNASQIVGTNPAQLGSYFIT